MITLLIVAVKVRRILYTERITRCLPVLLLVIFGTVFVAASEACKAGEVTGRVSHVRDGDTNELGSLAIRLSGLAAPEWNEPGGTLAREAMIKLAHGR